MGMPTGIVKVFHRSRGYGFIRPETGGEDIFVIAGRSKQLVSSTSEKARG